MLKKLIPFNKVPQLAKTDLAYATGDRALMPFYKYELRHEVFRQIIEDKKQQHNIPRAELVATLKAQYTQIPHLERTKLQIEALGDADTFTVTTAHQPCLFGGPLYFMYKAITAINLSEAIQGIVGPVAKIVPVFVLGTEDHDIDEVNHINLFHKTVRWEPGIGGAVGEIPTSTLTEVLAEIKAILGETDHARMMYQKLERAYTRQPNFASATQALLNDLFGRFGLVVLDMNAPALKAQIKPIIKAELTEQISHKLVLPVTEQLNALGFKTQATPREINLFYLQPGNRNRIVLQDDTYKVLNTDLSFTQAEILNELEQHPERFSPNVVLRPLFQESVLPNLAYVGGGGELAYWLERKPLFEHFKINYPVLVRRNSVLWIERDSVKKIQKFGISPVRFFEDVEAIVRQYVEENSATDVNLSGEINEVKRLFEEIADKAIQIDPTLEGAVRADAVKTQTLIEQWQGRLIRAEKQKHEVTLNQIRALKDKLFPGGGLQERHTNFMPFFLRYGERFFDIMKDKLLPLDQGFVVLEDQ
jgi:bacillithiol synthase